MSCSPCVEQFRTICNWHPHPRSQTHPQTPATAASGLCVTTLLRVLALLSVLLISRITFHVLVLMSLPRGMCLTPLTSWRWWSSMSFSIYFLYLQGCASWCFVPYLSCQVSNLGPPYPLLGLWEWLSWLSFPATVLPLLPPKLFLWFLARFLKQIFNHVTLFLKICQWLPMDVGLKCETFSMECEAALL